MNQLIIIGADIEIIELILNIGKNLIIGIVDKNLNGKYYGYSILGDDDYYLLQHKEEYLSMKLVITLDDVKIKEKLYEKYNSAGFSFEQVISPGARISSYSRFKEEVIIQSGANIGPNTSIGKISKINVNANIMHDVIVGDFNTIAPNAVTLGYVETGSNVFLGANSTIMPRCKIGSNIILGAGAIVTKNLESNFTYYGIPAVKKEPFKT